MWKEFVILLQLSKAEAVCAALCTVCWYFFKMLFNFKILQSHLRWMNKRRWIWGLKMNGVELESDLTRTLWPAPHLCLRLRATLAATNITHPNLWPNSQRSCCVVGNVATRFWRRTNICTHTMWFLCLRGLPLPFSPLVKLWSQLYFSFVLWTTVTHHGECKSLIRKSVIYHKCVNDFGLGILQTSEQDLNSAWTPRGCNVHWNHWSLKCKLSW